MLDDNLTGPNNWEKRFIKTFYDNGETPKGILEYGAHIALEWLKIYSPLNPDYEKEQEIKSHES